RGAVFRGRAESLVMGRVTFLRREACSGRKKLLQLLSKLRIVDCLAARRSQYQQCQRGQDEASTSCDSQRGTPRGAVTRLSGAHRAWVNASIATHGATC